MEFEKMQDIIAEVMNVPKEDITPDTKFVDDLGADSLDLFELVMALEDEYNIEIPAEDLTDILYPRSLQIPCQCLSSERFPGCCDPCDRFRSSESGYSPYPGRSNVRS